MWFSGVRLCGAGFLYRLVSRVGFRSFVDGLGEFCSFYCCFKILDLISVFLVLLVASVNEMNLGRCYVISYFWIWNCYGW